MGNYAGYSKEFFKFSVEAMAWSELGTAVGVTGTGPSARYAYSMTSVGSDIYLFGGHTAGEKREAEGECRMVEVKDGGARCVSGAWRLGMAQMC